LVSQPCLFLCAFINRQSPQLAFIERAPKHAQRMIGSPSNTIKESQSTCFSYTP
jgi:hypothetical protein